MVRPDAKDQEILDERVNAWDKREGPRVGDYLILPSGEVHRFSHDWGDGLQHSKGGSWYLGKGYQDFSGGLEPMISKQNMKQVNELRPGQVWFFHWDHWAAHNAVFASVQCRVFELINCYCSSLAYGRCDFCTGTRKPNCHDCGETGRCAPTCHQVTDFEVA